MLLLVDGVEKMAAFGCPHIKLDAAGISESDTFTKCPGYLISAVEGEGTLTRPLSSGALFNSKLLQKRQTIDNFENLRFLKTSRQPHHKCPDRQKIAAQLGAPWEPIHIYSTQLRYLSLALGFSDVVLRTPLPKDAPAHAWDHAGGAMIFKEAGGKVTDLNGKPLIFTAGRELTGNFGLIAAPESIHARVVDAVKAVFSSYPEYSGLITQES
jgi:3'(2'), 5'-bisphosphate nucleotidase